MLVTCKNCNHEYDESRMYVCLDKGEKTYECVDENNCKKIQNKKVDEQKILQEIFINKFIHLGKEEQLKEMHDVNFDDLEYEPKVQARDGCTPYIHKITRKIYKWNNFKGHWNPPTNI